MELGNDARDVLSNSEDAEIKGALGSILVALEAAYEHGQNRGSRTNPNDSTRQGIIKKSEVCKNISWRFHTSHRSFPYFNWRACADGVANSMLSTIRNEEDVMKPYLYRLACFLLALSFLSIGSLPARTQDRASLGRLDNQMPGIC